MKHAQDKSSHEGNNGGQSADRGKEVIHLTKHDRSQSRTRIQAKNIAWPTLRFAVSLSGSCAGKMAKSSRGNALI
jgi:hypothetical protein